MISRVPVPVPMTHDDFDWAAVLMERRRQLYEQYSPVFWRPARDVTGQHASFMRTVAARPGALAVRTDHGFLLSLPQEGRGFVDDFAVEAADHWETDGRALLEAARSHRSPDHQGVRVVTARRDAPKRELLRSSGLLAAARWWVRALAPEQPAPAAVADVDLGIVRALFIPAPPVYDPGGAVCVLGDVDADVAAEAAARAERKGAVLAVVQRDRSPGEAPASEPPLEAAGFHNASEFYDG